MEALTKLERIDAVIQHTTDVRILRRINRAWWREWFKTDEYKKFMSEIPVHSMDDWK